MRDDSEYIMNIITILYLTFEYYLLYFPVSFLYFGTSGVVVLDKQYYKYRYMYIPIRFYNFQMRK